MNRRFSYEGTTPLLYITFVVMAVICCNSYSQEATNPGPELLKLEEPQADLSWLVGNWRKINAVNFQGDYVHTSRAVENLVFELEPGSRSVVISGGFSDIPFFGRRKTFRFEAEIRETPKSAILIKYAVADDKESLGDLANRCVLMPTGELRWSGKTNNEPKQNVEVVKKTNNYFVLSVDGQAYEFLRNRKPPRSY